MINVSAATTRGKPSETFRTGKSGDLPDKPGSGTEADSRQTNSDTPNEKAAGTRLPVGGIPRKALRIHGPISAMPSFSWQTIPVRAVQGDDQRVENE